MPKKTKKQKILAQLHRKLTLLDVSSESVKSQNQKETTDHLSAKISTFSYHAKSLTKPNSPQRVIGYVYLKHDLIKITIFTLLAIVFQSVLYFLLRTR